MVRCSADLAAMAVAIGAFGIVVGFLTGYAVRAYVGYRHRRHNYGS
jgi:uncharacterized membrane protein (Fun14 family)